MNPSRKLPTTRLPKLVAKISLLAVICLISWVLGFIGFVAWIIPKNLDEKATPLARHRVWPAAVVLTGGSLRLEEGLKALQLGWADQLFISGVYPSTDIKRLLEIYQLNRYDEVSQRIELGHVAADTDGNGAEIVAWLKAQNFHEALVITSAYHMPRALLELETKDANIKFEPWPVFPPHVKLSNWWRYPGTSIFLAKEYNLFIMAWLRLNLWS